MQSTINFSNPTESDLATAVSAYAEMKQKQKLINQQVGVLERTVVELMIMGNSQTEFKTDEYSLTLKQDKKGCPVTFVQEFGELDTISKEQFDDIYTPEHEETKTIPAKINLQKIRKLKKFGSEIWNKAEKSILTGTYRISSFRELEIQKKESIKL